MRSGLMGWLRRMAANPVTLFVVLSVIVILAFSHFIAAKPAGLSPDELLAKNHSLSLSAFFNNPLNGPHKLLAFGLNSAGLSWQTALRLSSGLIAAVFLACFFWLAKSLFGRSIGYMGALVLLTTPLFIVMGRNGSGAIMLFSIVSIMAVYAWAIRQDSSNGLAILILVCALAVYSPGVLLWIIAAAVIARKKISALFETAHPPLVAAAVLVSFLIILPMGIAAAKDIHILKQLFLIPEHLPAPIRILKNLAWMILALFIKAPHHSPYIIGRLPVFNLILDALLIFGTVAMWSAARLKLIGLLSTAAYAVIFAAINDNISYLALGVPAAVVVACAGLRYLFIEWRRVFPRNPAAKYLAYGLMWALVFVHVIFGIRYGVVAWPSTADNRAAYVLK